MECNLYDITWKADRDRWLPSTSPTKSLNKDSLWNSNGGKAHFAAVAGRFDDKESASNSLPSHIISAYKKENMLTNNSEGRDHYSLFWSEKGAHKSEKAAQALASVMQQAIKSNLPVNWLVHGDGIHIFKQAAKILKSSPLASVSAVGINATEQNIYFSNPTSSIGEKKLKALCSDAGLTFLGLNSNNRDLRKWKTFKCIGCGIYNQISSAVLVGFGASVFSVALSAAKGSSTDDYTVVAVSTGILAAGVATILGLTKQIKPLAASVKCTFGKGNEKWYTDDKTLLS